MTYDGDPAIDPVLPILSAHRKIAERRLSESLNNDELSEEEAQDRFMDAVGRIAPLKGKK